METSKTYEILHDEIADLKEQLGEAHDIIEAIRKGEVDAFVVKAADKHELYTLQSADKTYRIFIERMNEGAVTLNAYSVIMYCNSSFAKFIQVPLTQVIGKAFSDFIPETYRNSVFELIKKAWTKKESKAEIIFPGRDKPLPVLLSMNTIEIDSGMALSIIITDLTLQKESQEQKKAMEQKDEFISIASHELKTPVTSIKGYVQILKYTFKQENNNSAVELLSKADAQLNKLSNLINDLLDVKKMENGQLQYNEDLFDFNELVKETIEEIARVLPLHPISIEFDKTCTVFGDRNKIGQVITNLIDNAGKYSVSGSPILVKTKQDKKSVHLSITDQGMGIPQSQQNKIFDRFFRVNGEKENTYAGLGLGLYISAEIIKRHKGNIGVESEESNGSVFYFDLPIEQ